MKQVSRRHWGRWHRFDSGLFNKKNRGNQGWVPTHPQSPRGWGWKGILLPQLHPPWNSTGLSSNEGAHPPPTLGFVCCMRVILIFATKHITLSCLLQLNILYYLESWKEARLGVRKGGYVSWLSLSHSLAWRVGHIHWAHLPHRNTGLITLGSSRSITT